MMMTLPIAVLMIVVQWKILTKANEEGWKVLIPFYGQYIFYKIAGATKYFWRSILAGVGGFVLMIIALACAANSGDSALAFVVIASICTVILSGYAIYCQIRFCFLLAKSFGKGNGFGVGLFLLSVIFYSILAFSSDISYHGCDSVQTEPSYVQSSGATQTVYNSTAYNPAPAAYNPAPSPHRSARLVGRSGIMVGRSLPIASTTVVGRSSSADIQLNDTTVSGKHCQFSWRGDSLFLMDLGSSNGTSVEGYGRIPAKVPVELRNKDIIRISSGNEFEVQI